MVASTGWFAAACALAAFAKRFSVPLPPATMHFARAQSPPQRPALHAGIRNTRMDYKRLAAGAAYASTISGLRARGRIFEARFIAHTATRYASSTARIAP